MAKVKFAGLSTSILTTHGQRCMFAVQGLEVGGVGVSRGQTVGLVCHPRQVADFVGTYVAVGAQATVGEGARIPTRRDQLANNQSVVDMTHPLQSHFHRENCVMPLPAPLSDYYRAGLGV